jgi:hypothetical protein
MTNEFWSIDRLRDEQPHHDPNCCEEKRQMVRGNGGNPLDPIWVAPDGLILQHHHLARAYKLEGIKIVPVWIASPGVVKMYAEEVKGRGLRSRKAASARWAGCDWGK